MATLHLVRQSAFNSNDFAQCLQTVANGDVITLLDDGCYNLKHPLMSAIASSIQVKIIEQHAKARGFDVDEQHFEKITMHKLVELTFTHERVITWQ